MKTIDYSPLETPVTETEIAAYKKQYGDTWVVTSNQHIWLFFLASAAGFVTAFSSGQSWAVFPAALVGIAGVAAGFISLGLFDMGKRRTKIARFAAANSATFERDQKDPGLSGLIFDEGDDRILRESLKFSDGIQMGTYEYTTGSGKNRQVNRWGFVSLPLPRKLPNMVLDSQKNNFFGLLSNLPDTFSKDQKLSLEGDFDTYFTLYAPKEYERDALYVFTPDVMQAAIDHGASYDMEVVDDRLYVYTQMNVDFSKPDNIKNLLDIVGKFGGELVQQEDNYADERMGNPTVNMVAPQGQRLRGGFNWLIVIAIVFYIVMTLFQFGSFSFQLQR